MADAIHEHQEHAPDVHVTPLWVYFTVFAALAAGTLLTWYGLDPRVARVEYHEPAIAPTQPRLREVVSARQRTARRQSEVAMITSPSGGV